MAAYAGTTTVVAETVFGNKRLVLLSVDITNYNATGIPLTKALVGMNVIEGVIVGFGGDLDIANGPIQGSYVPASDAVFLYKAKDTDLADDFNLNTNTIVVYLGVIGV